MKKFRHWIFKLLTGYDLADYVEILQWSERVLKLTIEIHNDNKEVIEHSRKVLELLHKELNANENLD